MNKFFHSIYTFLIMTLILLNSNSPVQAHEPNNASLGSYELHSSIALMCQDTLKNINNLSEQFQKVKEQFINLEEGVSLSSIEVSMLALYQELQLEVKSINLYALSLFNVIQSDNLESTNQVIISKLSELNTTIAKTISDKQNGYHNLDSEIEEYLAAINNAKEIYESLL